MLTQYISAAMHDAHYERMENGNYFATIPACKGVWAEGPTLEASRDELASTLEGWLLVKLNHGHVLPIVGGIDINPQPAYAEAY